MRNDDDIGAVQLVVKEQSAKTVRSVWVLVHHEGVACDEAWVEANAAGEGEDEGRNGEWVEGKVHCA